MGTAKGCLFILAQERYEILLQHVNLRELSLLLLQKYWYDLIYLEETFNKGQSILFMISLIVNEIKSADEILIYDLILRISPDEIFV